MDSALECMVFALNALGYGAGGGFRDITTSASIRHVGLRDVIGRHGEAPLREGYAVLFPIFQGVLEEHRSTIERVMDLHDVSKHRETIYTGGRLRNDPPAGFFDGLGVQPSSIAALLVTPHAEIMPRADPRRAAAEREPQPYDPEQSIEALTEGYVRLIAQSLNAALRDAKGRIALPRADFRE